MYSVNYIRCIQNDRMFFCFSSLCLHHDNHSISMKNDENKACIAVGIVIKSRLIVKPFAHMSSFLLIEMKSIQHDIFTGFISYIE